MEALQLTEREKVAFSLLRSLGYLTAAKETQKSWFSCYIKAILTFKANMGLPEKPCIDDEFMSALRFVAQIEGVYDEEIHQEVSIASS